LVPLGAETGFVPRPPEGSILVRFDLMRGLRLPEDDEPWVEAGPGASWLNLEDELDRRAEGLLEADTERMESSGTEVAGKRLSRGGPTRK
jgi:FAD/FMN-containing dehydrogenase